MIDLFHTLQSGDLGFLKMVASAWGIELNAPDAQTALQILIKAMLNPQLVDEILQVLPQDAIHVLEDLLKNDGILPWALFSSQHGEIRSMGPAKRDRERPDLYPDSPAEVLWYRGLIGRAFLELEREPQEYAFIPDDLIPYMITMLSEEVKLWGRPASPKETTVLQPVSDRILDDICTLLSALRLEMPASRIPPGFLAVPPVFLIDLLKTSGMIEEDLTTQPEAVRLHLEETRGYALAKLVDTWVNSQKINELRMLPHLKFEGTWLNYPLETRKSVLDLVSSLAEGSWWSLSAFLSSVRDQAPDFQRPAGDYDSWFILDKESGEYLKGRSSWDRVDGALLRFMICGPMHWLGLIDLARPAENEPSSAFKLSDWAQKLWHGGSPTGIPREEDPIWVNMDGQIRLSNFTPRTVRYQVGRFAEWESYKDKHYLYRISPQSLERAGSQGLRTHHLVNLLKKYASAGIPPSFLDALGRWERSGVEAKIYNTSLLRVEKPEILNQLLQTPAKRFLGEVLNPTTVEIKPGSQAAVKKAMFELGYLSGVDNTFSV
jgi:hypothetical protein